MSELAARQAGFRRLELCDTQPTDAALHKAMQEQQVLTDTVGNEGALSLVGWQELIDRSVALSDT